jgi:hypothetical protein
MSLGNLIGRCGLAIAAAIGGAIGSDVASANVLTFDLNQYDTSAVDPTAGQTLAIMTVTDIGGGVNVAVALESPAVYFASTGGGHITVGFHLDTTITSAAVTVTTPSPPTFVYTAPVDGVPGVPGGFGDFTAGEQGAWSGTSNHFAGPIDFTISGVSTADFTKNAAGYYVVADVLGPNGSGDVGANTVTITTAPEPATWGMMLLGFMGLGYAAYRRSDRPASAFA